MCEISFSSQKILLLSQKERSYNYELQLLPVIQYILYGNMYYLLHEFY